MESSVHQVITEDHVTIALSLYQLAGRDTVLIVCPGFFQSNQTATFRHLCQDLAEKRDVIGMDFRGHGRSGGWFTFSALEWKDLEAVVRFARTRYARIIILGFSLGAVSVINFAAKDSRLIHPPSPEAPTMDGEEGEARVLLRSRADKATAKQNTASQRFRPTGLQEGVTGMPMGLHKLIAVSAPISFEEIEFKFWTPEAMQTGMRGLEKGSGCRPGNLWQEKDRPIDHIKTIAPIPILFIHGTHDPIVSHHHSERLYESAGEPKRLVLIEGGGHAEELYRRSPERFLSLIQEWLDFG